LQPARANQDLLETAYRAGKVNLSTLLLLRNQLLDAELGYWDAWLARRTALIALQAATATLAPDGAVPTNDTGKKR
jgi:outer membrane protein TolC